MRLDMMSRADQMQLHQVPANQASDPLQDALPQSSASGARPPSQAADVRSREACLMC